MPHAQDFETSKAFRILDQHRDRMLCFNDDIQVSARDEEAIVAQGARGRERKGGRREPGRGMEGGEV